MLMVDDDIQMQLDVILDRFAKSGKQEKFRKFTKNHLKCSEIDQKLTKMFKN